VAGDRKESSVAALRAHAGKEDGRMSSHADWRRADKHEGVGVDSGERGR
jgi:hypothetical protein